MSDTKKSPVYRVSFYNRDKVYEIYTRQIYQSELGGFVELEEMVFDSSNQLVLDPAEEKLKHEFAQVKRTFIPMYSIIRIDEVERKGTSKIYQSKNERVAFFPGAAHKTSPQE